MTELNTVSVPLNQEINTKIRASVKSPWKTTLEGFFPIRAHGHHTGEALLKTCTETTQWGQSMQPTGGLHPTNFTSWSNQVETIKRECLKIIAQKTVK